jgi:hypothetical protein
VSNFFEDHNDGSWTLHADLLRAKLGLSIESSGKGGVHGQLDRGMFHDYIVPIWVEVAADFGNGEMRWVGSKSMTPDEAIQVGKVLIAEGERMNRAMVEWSLQQREEIESRRKP